MTRSVVRHPNRNNAIIQSVYLRKSNHLRPPLPQPKMSIMTKAAKSKRNVFIKRREGGCEFDGGRKCGMRCSSFGKITTHFAIQVFATETPFHCRNDAVPKHEYRASSTWNCGHISHSRAFEMRKAFQSLNRTQANSRQPEQQRVLSNESIMPICRPLNW